ncbi:hypothetical protein ACH495_07225 [Micromonospora sp. NPDC018662]|uniref:hypothetical protein n=1 Tax=Micromonospora sp. NPDC018662 TaxID=3364238 RepID=UPI00378F787C
MAFRTWGRLLLTALGVSVLAAAGQLGVAYGFGVVRLDGAFVDASVNRWPAQLAWVAWFAAVATVAGAVLTERLARWDDLPGGTTELLSIAGVSALGAIVVAPLCMQPARAAELGGSLDPVWAAGICAVLGAVVGAGAAIAVLLKPPFGWGVALTAGTVWLLALLSVAPTVVGNRSLATVRLGVLEPSWLGAPTAQRLAMLLLPTLALLAGGAIGVLARRAGHPPLVGGAAGAAGPALVAFAYLTAGPGTATDRYQLAPYYGALVAVAAGALGATATSMLPRPGTGDAVEPTDILAPLPAGASTTAATPATSAVTVPTPTSAGAPAPAHWDWPEADGPNAPRQVSPASPLATEQPDRPTPDARPDRPAPPTVGPDDEVPIRDLPMPGLLPPGRRTSAIDVLAAGRTGPQPPPDPTRSDPTGTDAPATAGRPAGVESPATVEPARPGPEFRPATTDAEPAAASPVDVSAPAAAPRATRPRRSRTVARSTPPTDESTPTERPAQPTVAETTPAGGPAPAPTGNDAAPAVARRPAARRPAGPPAATPQPVTPPPAAPPPLTPPPAAPQPVVPSAAARPPVVPPAATRPPATRPPVGTAAAGASAPPPDDVAAPAEPPATEPKPARRPRSFFFAPEPDSPAPPRSPRPRFPIFDDVTERPGDVRPAWPIPPAASRPTHPADAEAPGEPAATSGRPGGPAIAAGESAIAPGRKATGQDGDDATGRAEPTPRRRRQSLPEPGRSTGWDAFATSARPTDPTTPGTSVPAQGVAVAGDAGTDTTAPAGSGTEKAAGRHAGTDDAEAAGGKSKIRRGLFRRNRDRSGSDPADDATEPNATPDEEYVDWVAGLASDDNADDARSLRTGRHHRD